MGEPFRHRLRVRYGECDQQGVVFNAHYLAYFDISITELWRAAFGGYDFMLERGLDMVLAEAQLRFRAPARFDEALIVGIAVSHLGTTSMLTEHVIERQQDPSTVMTPSTVVTGSLRHVFVDPRTLEKTPIPDWLRSGLEPWTVAAPGSPEA